MKKCYVCGRPIEKDEPYFSLGYNTYVCSNDNCFEEYRWDYLAAKVAANDNHRYAVINHRLYLFELEPFYKKNEQVKVIFNDKYEQNGFLLYVCDIPDNQIKNIADNAIAV